MKICHGKTTFFREFCRLHCNVCFMIFTDAEDISIESLLVNMCLLQFKRIMAAFLIQQRTVL